MEWYISQEGLTSGPVSETDLLRDASEGRLHPDALVWRDGMPDWQKANSLVGTQPAFAGVLQQIGLGYRSGGEAFLRDIPFHPPHQTLVKHPANNTAQMRIEPKTRNPLIRSQMFYPVELRDRVHAARRSLRSEPDCTMRISSAA